MLTLDGYDNAYFLNITGVQVANGGKQLTIGLNPSQEKTLYVRVHSADVSSTPYTLQLDAVTADPADDTADSDAVSIMVEYPAEFPGLSWWAIVVLVVLSASVFYVMDFRKK